MTPPSLHIQRNNVRCWSLLYKKRYVRTMDGQRSTPCTEEDPIKRRRSVNFKDMDKDLNLNFKNLNVGGSLEGINEQDKAPLNDAVQKTNDKTQEMANRQTIADSTPQNAPIHLSLLPESPPKSPLSKIQQEAIESQSEYINSQKLSGLGQKRADHKTATPDHGLRRIGNLESKQPTQNQCSEQKRLAEQALLPPSEVKKVVMRQENKNCSIKIRSDLKPILMQCKPVMQTDNETSEQKHSPSSIEHAKNEETEIAMLSPFSSDLPPESPVSEIIQEIINNEYEYIRTTHNRSALELIKCEYDSDSSDVTSEYSLQHSSESETSEPKTGLYFVHGIYEKEHSYPCQQETVVSQPPCRYTFCHDFENGQCALAKCRFIHATEFERKHFNRTGVLPPHTIAHLKRSALSLLPPPPPPPEEPPAHQDVVTSPYYQYYTLDRNTPANMSVSNNRGLNLLSQTQDVNDMYAAGPSTSAGTSNITRSLKRKWREVDVLNDSPPIQRARQTCCTTSDTNISTSAVDMSTMHGTAYCTQQPYTHNSYNGYTAWPPTFASTSNVTNPLTENGRETANSHYALTSTAPRAAGQTFVSPYPSVLPPPPPPPSRSLIPPPLPRECYYYTPYNYYALQMYANGNFNTPYHLPAIFSMAGCFNHCMQVNPTFMGLSSNGSASNYTPVQTGSAVRNTDGNLNRENESRMTGNLPVGGHEEPRLIKLSPKFIKIMNILRLLQGKAVKPIEEVIKRIKEMTAAHGSDQNGCIDASAALPPLPSVSPPTGDFDIKQEVDK